jgi:hypothetical protein
MAMSSLRDKVVLAAVVVSCATPPPAAVPRVRFANAPPVLVVDDRRPVAVRPEVSHLLLDLDFVDRSLKDEFSRTLSLPLKHRARGVNSFDEVPDSTWFTNRIGVRYMSPEEIARGPEQDEGPEPHKPWTILSNKPGGTQLGFIIRDARGVKYGLGFDLPDWPEMKTGAAVVVNRLLYAFGYNVPDDRIAYVRPEELVVSPDAEIKDSQGRHLRGLDRNEVDRELALVSHTPDGRIRVLASRWLDGESLGGTPPAGVRKGDPNDRIPHQDRRDLRGQYPLFAWVQHIDLVQANFLDVLIAPPSDPSHRYVEHYLLDFGRGLGAGAVIEKDLRSSYEYIVDFSEPTITFGLVPRAWGHVWAPRLTGVSPTFVSEGFDPGAWKPDIPYAPFNAADRLDMFWGTKILAHFTPAQIRAAVEAARFSDPRTVAYLTNTLVARQRATLAHWYAQVNPLDQFTTTADALCFQDLAIGAQLASPAQTHYELASYDRYARPIGRIVIAASPNGATCTRAVRVAGDGDGYTMVRITTSRPGFAGSTFVHLARAPGTGAWRVIGVWRI